MNENSNIELNIENEPNAPCPRTEIRRITGFKAFGLKFRGWAAADPVHSWDVVFTLNTGESFVMKDVLSVDCPTRDQVLNIWMLDNSAATQIC
jgi:hypothetical protein